MACAMAKDKRKAIKKVTFSPETVPGRTVHIDISSVKPKIKGGAKFWIQIADRDTSKKWSFFLKKKSYQYNVIEKFLLELKVRGYETKFIDVHYRRKLRMDNSGENKKLKEILTLKKIKIYFEYTPVDGPEFNGVVERAFTTGYG